jgi:hypothetical protein
MSYADTARLNTILNEYDPNTLTTLLNESLDSADRYVDRFLAKQGLTVPSPTPNAIEDAATFRTVTEFLDILFSNQDKRSPLAIRYETDAKQALEDYMASLLYPDDEEDDHLPFLIDTIYNEDQMEEDEEEDS